jgi:hypothetical protein
MKQEQVQFGQRIRLHLPGTGDDGQLGTVRRVRGLRCYVHLDWDQRMEHVIVCYAPDLELVGEESTKEAR